MIAVDFFCGAGGLTRGLVNAGIPVTLGIDSASNLQTTYEANNPGSQFLNANVRRLDTAVVREALGDFNPDELLLTACAPCQPFAALYRLERQGDATTLLGQFARFVAELRPGQVVVENVPGLTRVRGYSTYRRFLALLEGLGYSYCEGVVDAKAYGVPQTRRRFLLIAVRAAAPSMPSPSHGPGLLPYVTVRDAIHSYPRIGAGETHPVVPNHRAAVLTERNLERIRNTPHDGGDRTVWPEHLWLECHKNGHEGHEDVYGRMRWQQPAPTLTGKCYSLSNGRYGHPEQDRAISLREAAKLQSFPDDYVFHATSLRQFGAQIGNAVPVKLAEAIGRHILMLRRQAPV